MLGVLVWDPDRNLFVIPYIHHPITWYGFLFALGFLLGFFILRHLFANFLSKNNINAADSRLAAVALTDRLIILTGICGILGARLGHVFFYDWPYYSKNLIDILKIWQGGLASHGGAIGGLIGLILFVFFSHSQKPKITFLVALDAIVVPMSLLAGFIRIGNFINQEITGTPTTLPWGVIFKHSLDGPRGIPVHPVQLYESFFYFFVFFVLYCLCRRKKEVLGGGELSGWFFFLVFSFRFLVEYIKIPQNEVFDVQGWLTMGQLLSIPFIILGAFLLIRYYRHVRTQ